MGQGLLSISFDRWHQRNVRARWAVLGDARIRQVGHLIRKTRLDELPQVINRVRVCLCRERSTLITRSVNVTKSRIVCGHYLPYRILLT
jgi:Bacterial sugar transferase